MSELFVEQSIEIQASASRVWDVMTNPLHTKEWIKKWWPDFAVLESEWKVGSPIRWKIADDIIGAEGTVSVVEPFTMLRFSFHVNDPTTSKQEELTYRFEKHPGGTKLSVSVGDFGDTPEHELCYPGAQEAWETSLPEIKELAES